MRLLRNYLLQCNEKKSIYSRSLALLLLLSVMAVVPQKLAASALRVLTCSPTSLNFGSIAVGSTSTGNLTLTNQGNPSVSISQITISGTAFKISGLGLPLTLSGGQSITFPVTFAPTTAGTFAGSISLNSNATSWSNVALSGTAVSAGLLSASPASINFGNLTVGSNSTQNITLANSGGASLSVSQAAVSGAGFSISGLSLPLTLAAGQSASFSVRFAPAAVGSVTGSISLVSNASNSPASVILSGAGVSSSLLLSASPSSLSFGSVTVASSAKQTVTLSNTGTGSVSLSQAALTGTSFSIGGLSLPLTLAAGQSTSFSVTFAPSAAGTATGSISLVSNASNSPAAVSLAGTGVTLILSMKPSSTAFGNVVLGTSTTLPVILYNTGTASVTVSQATVAGTGFSISGLSLPVNVAAGANVTLNVNFAPSTAGNVTGNISIVSNATGSPLSEPLSGTGVHAASLSWTASTSTNVTGYRIYRGGASGGPYTLLNPSLISGTSFTDTSVQAGQTYYYVTTSVDSGNIESAYSNQALAIVPSP
jgi:hypothetical protein